MNWNAVNELIELGYISKQKHPAADLYIYNYTAQTQYEWKWCEETEVCRGLIADADGRIVARPFRKFFSYEQLNGNLPSEPFEVYEKMDGSLGIMYFVGDEPAIATRGSFISDQAKWATNLIRHYADVVNFNPEYTYLFEIIYKDNRIVVDYGDMQDLVLLAIVDTATGKELPLPAPDYWADFGPPIVTRHDGFHSVEELRAVSDSNREGFVLRYESGFRVKIKLEEYKRLHKLLTGLNARHIWEMLVENQPLQPLYERVPDEFYKWVQDTERDLRAGYHLIESEAKRLFKDLGNRKDNAMYYQSCPHSHVLFSMLDGKDYSNYIWKQLRPVAALPFREDEA